MFSTQQADELERRVQRLALRGVVIVDPRQTFIAEDVDLQRVHPGAVLHPGTRLMGATTLLAPGAQVGVEGPCCLVNTVLDRKASIASGYAAGAVLLAGASAGANAHLRAGTLLEEQASTAHAVGLKQTILLSFVTLGSLINFCDVLMAGGVSRRDHSEVGSGFIHFNFTPFGAHGDKATPSLVGDVTRGVLLREPRIFLGGAGGLVGPGRVGYGSITGAGSVVRRPVPERRLVLESRGKLSREYRPGAVDGLARAGANVDFIAQLAALRAFYEQVRLVRAERAGDRLACDVLRAALRLIDDALRERVKRFASFLAERGAQIPELRFDTPSPCPLAVDGEGTHIDWVQALGTDDAARLSSWLDGVAQHTVAQFPAELRPRTRGATPASENDE